MDIILSYLDMGDIITSIIILILGIYVKGQFGKMEKRGKDRIAETIAKLKAIQAIGNLTYATSIAVKEGTSNGEMTSALEAYREAKVELDDFLITQHAKNK